MMIGMVLFWLVLLGAVIALASRLTGGRGIRPGGAAHPPRASTAEEILEERYARGEIDRDTYVRMRGDLGGRPPA